MPPNATTTTTTATTINAIETGDLTLKVQPDGITIVEGQSLIVTQWGHGNNDIGNDI
jgi:hypothetical protein